MKEFFKRLQIIFLKWKIVRGLRRWRRSLREASDARSRGMIDD